MTLTIDFTPQEIAWLNAQAQQQGLPPAEIIRRMVDAHLHDTAGLAAPINAEKAAALALLDGWIAEGIAADPETKRQAEEELEEFKHNMNANRAATGERLVYS